jgi:ribosome recycling factor
MNNIKNSLDKVIDKLNEELKGIRTGRANGGLVEGIKIDYYGTMTPIAQMSQITVPDAKTIMISPWNKDDLASIEKAITESDLNINPNNNGEAIILSLPPMTEERRLDLVKIVGSKVEETRIAIRQVRENFIDKANKEKKEGVISQDDFFGEKENIQKHVDDYNKKVEDIREKKEKEIKII